MNELIEYCCDELDELKSKIKKGGKLSMAETEYMDTLAHAKKNLMKGEEMSEEGYSGMMYPRYYGDDRMDGRSYNEGRSYARGRNARRDSMERYSRGYSMAADGMIEELRDLMREAPDDQTRMEFQKFITKIEQM